MWDEIGPIQERAYAGEPTFIEDFPLIVHRNGYPEQAYFTFSYGPIRDEHGRVLGMIDTVIETTAKVMADRNLRLINGELEHRIKNTLAMVCGIARQTFRRAISIEAAQETLLLRLEALGAAHSPLIQSKWTNAPIRAVIEGALAPYQSHAAQIALSGPPVELSARCSLSLGLAINELAANALKYGALSTEQGRITVRWTAGNPASDDPFNLVWEEQGGPPVAPATQSGFGQQLIHAVAADFGGEANTDLRETGAYFTLSTTMKQIDEHGAA
ncbi:hypothetical protein GCM10017653_49110 [Ancylobacter defluvii]|uniref:histidine kinase n=1 Tax=Ancylobacter defluvii TaxID=1282440 RepID=A0A9W6K258_9HYPH|nr:hypothetical protein GCM10017653_49110 [Ancylobacter defluvii]